MSDKTKPPSKPASKPSKPLAEAVCLELREHADYLEARRGALLDEIERLKRENATLRAAYAQDLDGLRAEVRRADDERDVRRAETARLTAERDAAHTVITGLREEISDAAHTVITGLREEISDAADTLHRLYLRAAQIVAAVGDPAAARMEPMIPSALDALAVAVGLNADGTDPRSEARAILDGVRAALGPTCADATHEALPGLVREVVQCDGATHERCDEQRDEIAALRGEVERLEGHRGEMLAEIDRLRSAAAAVQRELVNDDRSALLSHAEQVCHAQAKLALAHGELATAAKVARS